MAKGPALIKQEDLKKIAKAMQAAGIEEWQTVIDPASGKVAIMAGKSELTQRRSDWD